MDWKVRAASVLLCIIFLLISNHIVDAEKRIVCYYTNWSVYRPGTAKFSPQNINPYLCTHLIYAFGGFTKDNTLKPFDKYQDIEKGGYAKFNGLKTYNKKLKTMLAIGGWNEGSARFSPLVADPERREELIKNTVKFLRQNHFDGLDLDWEYPAFRDGGKPRDKDNYADFVQELRQEFERESSKTGRPRLLLSMAIPAGIEYLEKGYDLPRLNEYLDFFNLLSYDYHSAFEPAVNHHSPLYGLEENNEYNYDSELTIDYTISYLLNHEITPNKLVLGIPTYGRSYTLFNNEATEIGAPADGPGEEGDATREKGYLAYYEICENIAKSDEWEVVQPNSKAMGPYAVRGNQWVGYDDEEIVRVKAHYVTEKGLGGIMFWSIDNDDFRGKCHDRPYPLIEAAKEAMLSGNVRSNKKTTSASNRKKTKFQDDEDDSANRRLRTETNKRRPSSTTQSTRKRVSSTRTNHRSSGKNRSNFKKNNGEHEEDVGAEDNSVKESTNRNRDKSRSRTRTNSISSRRRAQSTEDDDDELENATELREESLSNKLTTPEPPTTPDPGSDFKCQDEGFFSHPRDCKKYFWCLDSGPSGLGIVANQFTCPAGLVFNKIADSCDYPRNVVCPKIKSTSATSTTKAPTTTRVAFQYKTTRKTTTTQAPSSEEEYEYEDDEEVEEEDEDENRNSDQSTTAKSLIYRTIVRNKPTTTTQTTESSTTAASRNFKSNTDKVLDLDDEEDPKVIKELIDLIKKVGGLEHLEKQLNLQVKNSSSNMNTANDEEQVTPATISRSLYERVLNRQATRIGGLLGSSTSRTTTRRDVVTQKIIMNSRVNYQNGPGGAQFEGLDEVPEVKSLRRTNKPQYVTIERPKPLSTQSSFSDEETDDELPQQDEYEQDNTNVASSEERAISNPDDDDTSTQEMTPSYVNIRRSRPSTPVVESDFEDEDKPSVSIGSDKETEKQGKNKQESSTLKSRYTHIERFRSTTFPSDTSVNSVGDASKLAENASNIPIDTTTSYNIDENEESSESSLSPKILLSTIESPLKLTTEPMEESSTSTKFLTTARTTINPSPSPTTVDPGVVSIENFVTEIPQTTLSIITTPKTVQTPSIKTTTTIPQPRPFSHPRRGRPTSTTTTRSSNTTDQNRAKVDPKYFKELPTLKELINNNSDINFNISKSLESSFIKYTQGIQIPVKILSGLENEEMMDNEFTILHLPEDTPNTTKQRDTVRIQLKDQSTYEENTESGINVENLTEENLIDYATEKSTINYDTTTTIPSTEHFIRGFYVTKNLDESQATTITSTDVEKTTSHIPENASRSSSIFCTDSTTSPSMSEIDFTSDENYLGKQSTSEYSEKIDNYQDRTTEFPTTPSKTSSLTTLFTTTSPTSSQRQRRIKTIETITAHRRPTPSHRIQSQHHSVAVHQNQVADDIETPRPRKQLGTFVRKRFKSESIDDQNIAESQPYKFVTNVTLPLILQDVSDESRTEDVSATVEINLSRSPDISLRKPGNIVKPKERDRSKPLLRNPVVANTRVSETQNSRRRPVDTYDQSGRAQELLPVSIVNPPNVTSTIEKGIETPTRIRDYQRFKIETINYDDVYTEPPTIVRTTIAPTRRRHKPKNEDKRNIDVTSPRSRRPAIIDYDYYVDEEVRLSIKPELKDKIYITKTGVIRCLDQGSFAHPTSCKKFITCAPMVGGQVTATEYTCPAKLSFDPVGGICNWSAGLGCKETSL